MGQSKSFVPSFLSVSTVRSLRRKLGPTRMRSSGQTLFSLSWNVKELFWVIKVAEFFFLQDHNKTMFQDVPSHDGAVVSAGAWAIVFLFALTRLNRSGISAWLSPGVRFTSNEFTCGAGSAARVVEDGHALHAYRKIQSRRRSCFGTTTNSSYYSHWALELTRWEAWIKHVYD